MRNLMAKAAVCFFTAVFVIAFLAVFTPFKSNIVLAADNPPGTSPDDVPYASDEVIIKFKESASNEKRANILDSLGGNHKQLGLKNIAKSKVPKDKPLNEYISDLNSDPDIEYAQPNYRYYLEVTVNDPFTSPTDPDYQWFHDKINTFGAWDYTMGSGVTVAVLDTGAYVSNSDLGSNIILKPDVALEDTNGDFIGDSDDGSEDDNGHGTHVAGIIAATAGNAFYGAGIAPESTVLVYDVFKNYEVTTTDGDGNIVGTGEWQFGAFTSDIVDAVELAVADGAKVINMSFGGYNLDPAKEDAINYAVENGVTVVCSAGNNSTSAFHTPSDYDNAISVIYTDANDLIGSVSNFGPEKDISAPGDNIISTYLDGYTSASGTSMAAPHGSRVSALSYFRRTRRLLPTRRLLKTRRLLSRG